MLTPAVLAYLTWALKNPVATFNAHAVGNALYGLQQLSDSPESRALVRALTPKVAACAQHLNEQMSRTLCTGSRRCLTRRKHRGLVAALAPKVQARRARLGAQAVPNSLYSLQALGAAAQGRWPPWLTP